MKPALSTKATKVRPTRSQKKSAVRACAKKPITKKLSVNGEKKTEQDYPILTFSPDGNLAEDLMRIGKAFGGINLKELIDR